jgi:hypothetical protein
VQGAEIPVGDAMREYVPDGEVGLGESSEHSNLKPRIQECPDNKLLLTGLPGVGEAVGHVPG